MDLGPHFRPKLAHVGAKLAILAPLGPPLAALWRHLGVVLLVSAGGITFDTFFAIFCMRL